MQYPPTPSSSRSGRALASPPTQTGYGYAVPGAPLMSSRALPSSPNPSAHAQHGSQPSAPYMSTVPLPGQVHNPFGLLTPPSSPPRPRGQLLLNPILTPQYAAGFHFDLRRPVEYIRFPPGSDASLLDAPATNPGVGVIQIVVFFDTIRIEVSNPSGITVRDVFHRLHRELNKRAEPIEVMRATQAKGVQTAAPAHAGAATKRIDLLAPSVVFAGLTYSGDAFSLIVRH